MSFSQQAERDWMRRRLLADVHVTPVGNEQRSLEQLAEDESAGWKFEEMMRVRLMMGRFRYGPRDPSMGYFYDTPHEAAKRIHYYLQSGNTEFLVDAANYCKLAFLHDPHPNKHFHAADDGVHAKRQV